MRFPSSQCLKNVLAAELCCPELAEGAYSAPQNLLAGSEGAASRKEMWKKLGERERKERGRKSRRRDKRDGRTRQEWMGGEKENLMLYSFVSMRALQNGPWTKTAHVYVQNGPQLHPKRPQLGQQAQLPLRNRASTMYFYVTKLLSIAVTTYTSEAYVRIICYRT